MGGFRSETLVARVGTDAGAETASAARAVAYKLERGLGVARREDELTAQLQALGDAARLALAGEGLREGRRFVYVEGALAPVALERRRVLASVWLGKPPPEGVPSDAELPAAAFGGPGEAALFAYEIAGPVARRYDVVERAAAKRKRKRRRRRRREGPGRGEAT